MPGGHQCPGRLCPCAREGAQAGGAQEGREREPESQEAQWRRCSRLGNRPAPWTASAMPRTCLQKRQKQMQSLEALSQQEWPRTSWAGKRCGHRGSRPLPS